MSLRYYFLFIFYCVSYFSLHAQDSFSIDRVPIYHKNIILPDKLLEIKNQLPSRINNVSTERKIDWESLDKELVEQIADVYRMHVLSLEAQLNNDALSAEKYIRLGLESLQTMVVERSEIQSDRRFGEVYRTVMTEYQEFYGITDPELEENGEIFRIQKEMFGELELDINTKDYRFPVTETIKTTVPLIQNNYVNNHLAYLWIKRPDIMETWLKRKERYFPMMERIFKEEGTPTELMHLAMIESGLNPNARSWAAATGMWQFIKATGGMYGLEVNWWVDERRDPEKATRAAARHLRDLYNVWGDWHLAIANYNVSPRRIRWAIRQSNNVKDYWEIYYYLPKETRGYVPSFIAATMITTNPESFGFQKHYDDYQPYMYEIAEVQGSIDLKVLARLAGISVEELKDYNPELLRWATPPGSSAYPLKLPTGSKVTFLANYKDLPESERREIFVHTVKRGESLGKIANRYGITVRDLYLSNEGISSLIYPGQNIMIPVPEGSDLKILPDKPSNTSSKKNYTSSSYSKLTQPPNTVKLVYTVKSGDTIGHIAEWFDTKASNIRAWNRINNFIRVGQKLTIYVPENRRDYYAAINSMSFTAKQNRQNSHNLTSQTTLNDIDGYVTYKVKRNDSLYEIAKQFGTTVSQLKSVNNLRGSRIYPGQTLKIHKK